MICPQDEFHCLITFAILCRYRASQRKKWLKKYFAIFRPTIRITINWGINVFFQPLIKIYSNLTALFNLTLIASQLHANPFTLLWKQIKRLVIKQNFLTHLIFMYVTASTAIETRIAKFSPDKAFQWYAACSKRVRSNLKEAK